MEYARAAPDLVANGRFLGDWRDDQQQYQALMDSGLTFAKALKLRPGIALTANQAGDLTPQGALLSGDSVAIKTTSDITNAGNIHNLAGLIRRPPPFSVEPGFGVRWLT